MTTASARRAPLPVARLAALLLLGAASPALAKEQPKGKPLEHQGYFATYPTGLRSLLGHEVIMVVGDAKVVGPQLKDSGFEAELVKSTP